MRASRRKEKESAGRREREPLKSTLGLVASPLFSRER